MPRARTDMRRIREVLRLRDEFGTSQRQIAVPAGCRATPCAITWSGCEPPGLRYADVLGWTDVELEERMIPPLCCP